MRVLLDESVPAPLRRHLSGHEVRTAPRMRWGGIRNGQLLRRAAAEFDVFITMDKSIVHQQVLPAGLSIITLRARNSRVETVNALAPQILRALESIQPGESLEVTQPTTPD